MVTVEYPVPPNVERVETWSPRSEYCGSTNMMLSEGSGWYHPVARCFAPVRTGRITQIAWETQIPAKIAEICEYLGEYTYPGMYALHCQFPKLEVPGFGRAYPYHLIVTNERDSSVAWMVWMQLLRSTLEHLCPAWVELSPREHLLLALLDETRATPNHSPFGYRELNETTLDRVLVALREGYYNTKFSWGLVHELTGLLFGEF